MTRENSDPNERLAKTSVQPNDALDQVNETIVVEAPFDSDAIVAPEQRNSRIIRAKDSSSYSKIADICLYFENNWTPERTFSIKDALRYLPPELRREAFKELACIDISLGAINNASIALPKYKAEFPSWTKEVDEAYKAAMTDSSVLRQSRIGRKLGNLRLEGIIGKGGMGVVYKAFNEDLQRYDAVKYIAPIRGDEKKKLDFIRVELVTNGQVKDPRFARAYGSGNDGDFHYLVMEYVDGVDLVRYLRNDKGTRPKAGPISLEEAARYVCEIAKGLCSIHRKGIIHRDIKPENIMLDEEGQIRILDLGLAKWHEGDLQASDTDDAVVGTPAYMSPECYSHPELVDEQSDIYSLGGVFFFLVTGKLPLARYNPRGSEAPRSLSEFITTPSTVKKSKNLSKIGDAIPESTEAALQSFTPPPSVNARLVKVMEKMLAPDRDKRYKKAQEVVDDLETILEEEQTAETTRLRKIRDRALVGGVAILAVAFFVTLGLFLADRARRATAPTAPTDSLALAIRVSEAESVFQVEDFEDGLTVVGLKASDAPFDEDELIIPGYIGEKRVLRVGDGAFEKLPIRRVVISEGVREVGKKAFYENKRLEELVLPETLERIDREAFAYSSALRKIALPSRLKIIGEDAFYESRSSGALAIPDSLLQIGIGAFSCVDGVTAFEASDRATSCKVVDGVLFSFDKRTLRAYPVDKPESNYVVPPETIEIAHGAFHGAKFLESITIHAKCKIQYGVFARSENLREIVFERSPGGYSAFDATVVDGKIYTDGGKTLFGCATGREEDTIVVPEGVEQIAHLALSGAKMTSIEFPSSLRFVGNYVFYKCGTLTDVSFPPSLRSLGRGAFEDAKSLKSVAISDDSIRKIEKDTFRGCAALETVKLGAGVEEIGESAFIECKSLKSIRLPDGLTTIGDKAFSGCDSLESIVLPKSVEQIGENAFPPETKVVREGE